MDLGGGLRGVDMGPSAIRLAGLRRAVERLGISFEDLGNVPVQRPETRHPGDPKARFLREITHCCKRLRDRVKLMLEQDRFPLIVGGDHSIAVGTVAGVSSHYEAQAKKIGLIWFDAHADMNTPDSSPSGNVHGMPLASVLGHGAPALTELGAGKPMVAVENAVLIGIRDVDVKERELVHQTGIRAYSMREIDILGMDRVMREAMEIATKGTAGFHLSFDMDGCDPIDAPGVGTPVEAGVTQREAHLMMEHAAESGKLLSLEMTEINPIVDDRNQTATYAVQLVLSALGQRIV
ncbi:MAG: arginase [Planctomycetota bacterium]|jgi:arginase